MDMTTLMQVIEQQGSEWQAGFADLKTRVDQIELKAARPAGMGGTGGATPPAELKALDQAVRALIVGDQAKAYRHFHEAKAMSAGSDPDGGYVVHPVMSSGMTKVMADISPVYRLARRVPMTTGASFEEPIDREQLDATWVSELGSRSDTPTPALGLFTVPLHEIYTMPKLSQKLIDTASINVVQWLTDKSGEAFAIKEGQAFHDGNGVGRPRGFMSYTLSTAGDATRTWGQVQYLFTGASGAFPTSSTTVNPADILVDVVSAMKAQYRNGAVWLMNRTTAGICRKLKDSEGRHVWVDSLVLGAPSVLLGYPVEIDEQMPDVGANALAIAFVNLAKAYTIIEQPGVKFLADPYTNKPNVLLYSYRRIGGGLNNSEAVKLLKFGTS
jgi:HK97 family phage major capsid protein